jgi:hypothetical protein
MGLNMALPSSLPVADGHVVSMDMGERSFRDHATDVYLQPLEVLPAFLHPF